MTGGVSWVGKEALSNQHSAFSPRSGLVLFWPTFSPARLQKAKEARVRSQHYHRLKFNWIEQRVTLMQGKPEVRRATNPGPNTGLGAWPMRIWFWWML
jgi:hypothetical protein